MGVWRFAVSAVALAAVVDVGQSAPLQAVVAAEIAMGSLDPFHESIALGGQQIVWDADTEGCDRGISAPLLTAAHSGYAIEIYEVSSRGTPSPLALRPAATTPSPMMNMTTAVTFSPRATTNKTVRRGPEGSAPSMCANWRRHQHGLSESTAFGYPPSAGRQAGGHGRWRTRGHCCVLPTAAVASGVRTGGDGGDGSIQRCRRRRGRSGEGPRSKHHCFATREVFPVASPRIFIICHIHKV